MPSTTDALELDVTRPFRIRWTRADCTRFEQEGFLMPGKYELIEGDILKDMGQNRAHINSVMAAIRSLFILFGEHYVQGPGPIDVSPEDNPTSEPEPDVTVLARPLTEFTEANPRPEDIRLVVEISDVTRYFDRGTKADLYARAAIVEYWSLDLVQRVLYVHREPREGKYQSVVSYPEAHEVAPLAAPQATLLVSTMLPPSKTE